MVLVKRLAWVLIGIAIGFALGTTTTVRAQQHQVPSVLQTHPVQTQLPGLVFVGDAKTHSCWLASQDVNGSGPVRALAPAPAEACQ
jgi:hypothetical protein